MFCINCGKEVYETGLFCQHCGSKVGSAGQNNAQDGIVPGATSDTIVQCTDAKDSIAPKAEGAGHGNTDYPLVLWAIGKIGFLLVVIGFFLPVIRIFRARTGFQLANEIMGNYNPMLGLLMYAVFISAIVGLCISVLLMISRKIKTPVDFDWIFSLVCISVSILSGVISFSSRLSASHVSLQDQLSINRIQLESGAYLILIGWGVTVAAEFFGRAVAKVKQEIVVASFNPSEDE